MPKRYPAKAREVAVALYLEHLSVPEITRRLNEGTAGLLDKEGKVQPLDIGERRVAEYVAEHKAKHGPRKEPEDEELTVDSINRVKQRALNVLAREIAHLEQLPNGRITAKQSTALRQHYATLDDMERRQELAEKRKGKGKRRKAPASSDNPKSAIDALVVAEGAGHSEGHLEEAERPQSNPQSREQGDIEKDGAMSKEEFEEWQGKLEAEGHIYPKDSPERRLIERRSAAHARGLSKEELDEIMGSAQA